MGSYNVIIKYIQEAWKAGIVFSHFIDKESNDQETQTT